MRVCEGGGVRGGVCSVQRHHFHNYPVRVWSGVGYTSHANPPPTCRCVCMNKNIKNIFHNAQYKLSM